MQKTTSWEITTTACWSAETAEAGRAAELSGPPVCRCSRKAKGSGITWPEQRRRREGKGGKGMMEKETSRTASGRCRNQAGEWGQSHQKKRWQEREKNRRDPSEPGMNSNKRNQRSLCSQEPYGAPANSKSDTELTEVLRGSEEYSRFWGNCPRFEVREHRKQNTCTRGPLWIASTQCFTSTLPAYYITISSLL